MFFFKVAFIALTKTYTKKPSSLKLSFTVINLPVILTRIYDDENFRIKCTEFALFSAFDLQLFLGFLRAYSAYQLNSTGMYLTCLVVVLGEAEGAVQVCRLLSGPQVLGTGLLPDSWKRTHPFP